jgi:hypothetical protein
VLCGAVAIGWLMRRGLRNPDGAPTLLLDHGVDPTHPGAGRDAVAMPLDGESHHFVASAPRLKMKWAALLLYGGVAAMIGLPFALDAVFHVATGTALEGIHWLMISFIGLMLLSLCSSRVRLFMHSFAYSEIALCLTRDSVIVYDGEGVVFPLIDAQLGVWIRQAQLCTCEMPISGLFSADVVIPVQWARGSMRSASTASMHGCPPQISTPS